MRRFLFWGFKSSRDFLERSLGSLEREVMALVWDRGEITVRDGCDRLGSTIAYTTVMTTMDRLFRKGLLTRRKAGRDDDWCGACVFPGTEGRRQREEPGARQVRL